MEKDINPIPEIVLFPTIEKIKNAAKFVINHFYPINGDEVLYTGGAALLDKELYDQQQFTWTYPDEREQL